jgi:hypothetical protein
VTLATIASPSILTATATLSSATYHPNLAAMSSLTNPPATTSSTFLPTTATLQVVHQAPSHQHTAPPPPPPPPPCSTATPIAAASSMGASSSKTSKKTRRTKRVHNRREVLDAVSTFDRDEMKGVMRILYPNQLLIESDGCDLEAGMYCADAAQVHCTWYSCCFVC